MTINCRVPSVRHFLCSILRHNHGMSVEKAIRFTVGAMSIIFHLRAIQGGLATYLTDLSEIFRGT